MTLARILEPELMDTEEDAEEYHAMDFSEPDRLFAADALRLIERVERPEIADFGTGTAKIPVLMCERRKDLRVLALHVFPNVLPPMMVQISLNMGWAILNAAGLSFIGMGVRPPQAEWGIMVAEGATYIISGEWWVALFPGAILMLAVFTFNLLGDGLRDIMDPRMRT